MTGYMQVTEDGMFALLGIIAAIDGRNWADTKAVRAAAVTWQETIRRELERRHFTLTDALAAEAVYAWYGRESRRVMPADILDMAAEIRQDRLRAIPMPDPPEHPAGPDGWRLDTGGYDAVHQAGQDVIAAGGTRAAAAAAMAAVAGRRPRELNGRPA